MRTRFAGLASLVMGASLFLAMVAPVAAVSSAHIRVLHASPDAPAVDVWVDGSKVLDNVAFKGISGYLSVPGGAHQIQVYAHGSVVSPVIDATPSFAAGSWYTVAAVGKLASIAPAVFIDNVSPTSGMAMLRVIHLSPDTGAVDVAVSGQTPAEAPVKNLSFPNASGYLTLPVSTYHFEVRPTGSSTVALDLPGVALAAGTNYTVFAVGLSDGNVPLSVVVTADAQLPPPTSTATDSAPAGNSSLPILAGMALLALAATATVLRVRLGSVRAR
jgi:hypothetical protein